MPRIPTTETIATQLTQDEQIALAKNLWARIQSHSLELRCLNGPDFMTGKNLSASLKEVALEGEDQQSVDGPLQDEIVYSHDWNDTGEIFPIDEAEFVQSHLDHEFKMFSLDEELLGMSHPKLLSWLVDNYADHLG